MDQGGGEMYRLLNKALQFTLTLVLTNLMISLARLFWGAEWTMNTRVMEVVLQMSLLMMNWKAKSKWLTGRI